MTKIRRHPIWMTTLAIAAPLLACSSNSDETTTPPPITTVATPAITTSAPTPACYPSRPAEDPELAAFLAGLALPSGAQVITGMIGTDSDKPGKVGVIVDLCVPASSNSTALKPIATQIAAALKPTPLGGRTFALWVSDKDSSFKDEAKVKDPSFDVHLWNGKPSPAAELQRWVVVTG